MVGGLGVTRSFAARATSAAPVGAMRYLPAKVVDEMGELHMSDPGRWTAAALSARFGAPPGAAAAAVTLAVRRQKNGRGKIESCAALAEQWAKLAEPGNTGRRRGRPDHVSAEDTIARSGETNLKPRFSIIDDVYEAVLRREEAEGSVAPSSVEGEAIPADTEAADVRVEEEDSRSEVQRWADALIEDGSSVDSKRKVSYAFIEGGVPNGQARAVWVRDGPSGMLRAATHEERGHLLGKPQAREQKPRRKV
jgi:hypothetical protein